MSAALQAAEPELALLRSRLAGSAESPRRLATLDLPLKLDRMIERTAASLRAAAVLIPVVAREDGAHLLLTRRSESLRQHKGQISFPGGARDPGDESFAAAAIREAHEEVGLPRAAVEVIGYLDDYPTITGFRITPVVGIVREAFAPRLAEQEVAELFELPLARVLAPGGFERKILSRDGLNVPFFELNFGVYRIWGATAGILRELRRVLLGER